MGEAIGQSLPLAIGVALSPVPIIAVVLMLTTPRAPRQWARVRPRLAGRPGSGRRGRAGARRTGWRQRGGPAGDLGELAQAGPGAGVAASGGAAVPRPSPRGGGGPAAP